MQLKFHLFIDIFIYLSINQLILYLLKYLEKSLYSSDLWGPVLHISIYLTVLGSTSRLGASPRSSLRPFPTPSIYLSLNIYFSLSIYLSINLFIIYLYNLSIYLFQDQPADWGHPQDPLPVLPPAHRQDPPHAPLLPQGIQ